MDLLAGDHEQLSADGEGREAHRRGHAVAPAERARARVVGAQDARGVADVVRTLEGLRPRLGSRFEVPPDLTPDRRFYDS